MAGCFRFSMANMMVVVLCASVAFAALRYATPITACIVFTLVGSVLLASLLGGLFCSGRPRVFSVGFAVFGWAYLIVTFSPWFRTLGPYGRWDADKLVVITEPLLERLAKALIEAPGFNRFAFMQTGHLLSALLCGTVGGLIGCYFHGKPVRVG